VALLVTAAAGHASERDAKEPVQLRADSIEIDRRSGVSRYSGNVSLRQGALHLTADRASATRQQQALETVRAEGNPAVVTQRSETGTVTIEGRVIVYDATSRIVTVAQNVRARRNGDEVQGHELRYDLETEQLDVYGMPGKRVSAVLWPERSTPATR
jgi:lipopolysaccharide export system protein LptA